MSCHESERESAVNPPHQTLSTSCQDCHSERQWVPAELAMGHSRASTRTAENSGCARSGGQNALPSLIPKRLAIVAMGQKPVNEA